jgi:GT2 family glycosyltransferase
MMDVTVVIVTYKTDPDVLRACLMSLAASHDVSFDVVLVDNAGNEKMPAFVHEILPEARVKVNTKNRGFARAVNVGLQECTGRYALLLNPDAIVPPGVLGKMVGHLDTDKEVGVGSCVIRYPDGTLQESIRRFPRLLDQLLILLKLPHVFKRLRAVDRYMMRDADPLKTQDVDSIMGAFMLIRREVLGEIGFLDERFFIWFEEVDFCKRVVDAGHKVRHYGDCEVIHHKGHSFAQVATLKKQKWVRTSLRKYMGKHNGLFAWCVLWLFTPIFILLAYVAAIFR